MIFFIQVVLNMKIHFHGALGGRFPLNDRHGEHVHSYPSTLVLIHKVGFKGIDIFLESIP